ncbi:MAG: 3-isopropylmalate dehydrogenase [Acidobacteria bacterium]|nr:3-isopropylmalate dehydrogenase [Acidobacteriota bacterium]
MDLNILVLPGDGIGPEVTREAVKVLETVAGTGGHRLEVTDGVIGGAALCSTGHPLPPETRDRARKSGAVLLGAVGSPAFDGLPPQRRPEQGLLELRRTMGVYANLRPVRAWAPLGNASPLQETVVAGTDLLIVRELTGGLYYGRPRGLFGDGARAEAVNTMRYSHAEIDRVARIAFEEARRRRRKVTSVDKSNVLECSQLWRRVVAEVAADYPEVELEHLLVDTCAMQLILNPNRFDVLLTENMFGDILSDEAAVLVGSIGLLASASLGDAGPGGGRVGLYEPVHGSAPGLAGRGAANPLGAIGSAAALLRLSFGLAAEADAVEAAIAAVIGNGVLTADLRPDQPAGTAEVGDAVCAALRRAA